MWRSAKLPYSINPSTGITLQYTVGVEENRQDIWFCRFHNRILVVGVLMGNRRLVLRIQRIPIEKLKISASASWVDHQPIVVEQLQAKTGYGDVTIEHLQASRGVSIETY